MKYTDVIIHYGEIGLKGKNRPVFEKRLINNISLKTGIENKNIYRDNGLMSFKLEEDLNIDKLDKELSKIPGIATYAFTNSLESKDEDENIEFIKQKSVELLSNIEYKTFKVQAKRLDKNFKKKSVEINREVGEYLFNKFNIPAKMKNPDAILYVEISHKKTHVFLNKKVGVDGLPTNNKNILVCMLSGGIDSPVAAHMLMKRGVKVVLVHFQNNTNVTNFVQDKIEQLAEKLSGFQTETELYIVPFESLQKEIIMKVQAESRMLIYRRFMLRISESICEDIGAQGIITGDNLSQVASQTLSNINAVYSAVNKVVMSPLIGFNKNDIISIAKKIDTFDISILPYGDCCSFFLPKHPELNSRTNTLERMESNLNIDELINKAKESMTIKKF